MTAKTTITLDRRELSTALAALRYWQRLAFAQDERGPEDDIASDGGTISILDPEEIDDLCERINVAEVNATPAAQEGLSEFTIEATYRRPVFRHRTYGASSIEDACRQAIEDDDWEGQREDYDSVGPTYITGAWIGPAAHEGASLELPPSVRTRDASQTVDLIRDAIGAIDSLLHQVGQMSGMFDDADGTIAEAVEDGEETAERLRAVIS